MSSIGEIAHLTEATSGDAAGMARVEAAARRQLASVGVNLAGVDVGGFQEDLGWDLAMVAEVGGDLVGLVRATADLDRILVDQLSIEPAWGRQGIGPSLVGHLSMTASSRGFRRVAGTTGGFNWSPQHLDEEGGVGRGDRALEYEDQRCARAGSSAVAC
ncbi:GNAT family N-acetyltransferase [Arsenicicoccus dermatophilus]|uniref:GNAT family N-acetyltransferase n=1 Tax=Arsenicicoccus dermatophilus TaxID=1076331 RepID=UPI0039173511